uniref:Cullin family profile domain-containing protein n=1 Tax=Acrobeloides nanus TaxID=290746 RepID=A0A914C164_9BILA
MENLPRKRRLVKLEEFLRKENGIKLDTKKPRLSCDDNIPLIDLTNSSNSPQDKIPNEVPILHPVEQFGVDHPEDPDWPLMPGARVYVRFFKNYKPAIVCGLSENGQYKVFDMKENLYQYVPQKFAIPICKLLKKVEVTSEKEIGSFLVESMPVTIEEWFDGIFILGTKNSIATLRISWDCLYLSNTQAERILNKTEYPDSNGEILLDFQEPSTSTEQVLPDPNETVISLDPIEESHPVPSLSPQTLKKNYSPSQRRHFPLDYNSQEGPSTSKALSLADILDEDILDLEATFYSNCDAPKANFEKCKHCSYSMKIEEHPEIVQYFICRKCKAQFCRLCHRDMVVHAIYSCADLNNEQANEAEAQTQQALIEEVMNEVYETHTSKTFARLCENVGTKQYYSEIFTAQFEFMLKKNRLEDLTRIFELWEPIEDVLSNFKNIFSTFLVNQCKEPIDLAIRVLSQDPKLFINKIQELHVCFNTIIEHVFKNHPNFVEIFEENGVFHRLIIERLQILGLTLKIEEILVRYCDFLLRKKSLTEPQSEDLELELSKVALALKYVPQQLLFYKFYNRTLAKRLLNNMSKSYASENLMLIKLKEVFGDKFIEKWQKMISDAESSQAMMKRYYQHIRGSNFTGIFRKTLSQILPSKKMNIPHEETIFSAKILTSGAWPLTSDQNLMGNFAKELTATLENFENFYYSENQNRKLIWIRHAFRGEIVTSGVFEKNYIFLAAMPQVSILMLYNEADSLQMEILLQKIGLIKEELVFYLKPIVQIGLLKIADETSNEDNLSEDTLLDLNLEFSSPKSKIDLTKALPYTRFYAKQESVQETSITSLKTQTSNNCITMNKEIDTLAPLQNNESESCFVIQASIAQIMKAKKKMNHNELLKSVQSNLKERFEAPILAIKKSIDALIEKEILARTFMKKQRGRISKNENLNDPNEDIVYTYIP